MTKYVKIRGRKYDKAKLDAVRERERKRKERKPKSHTKQKTYAKKSEEKKTEL